MAEHAIDTLGEPIVTAGGENLPPLIVEFNDDVHGFIHGDQIEPGKQYALHVNEATVSVMEGKARMVGVGEHGRFGLVKPKAARKRSRK